jgi:hypothetical protein
MSKKPPANPVPPEALGKFADYVAYWQGVLCLGDWRINVSATWSRRDVMAELFRVDLEQRQATIKLGKDFGGTPVTDESLRETALHEVLHIFNHELIETAKVADQPEDTIRSAEHRMINVLERLLADKA